MNSTIYNRATLGLELDADDAEALRHFLEITMHSMEAHAEDTRRIADGLRDQYRHAHDNYKACMEHGNLKGAEHNKHSLALITRDWGKASEEEDDSWLALNLAKEIRNALDQFKGETRKAEAGQ
jgi:hypothetical protein